MLFWSSVLSKAFSRDVIIGIKAFNSSVFAYLRVLATSAETRFLKFSSSALALRASS